MGGLGSGRMWHYGAKSTVEECKSININYLNRNNLLNGRIHSISWTRGGKETGSIVLQAIGEDKLRLSYTVDKEKKLDYKVQLDKVKMNFGGHKLYFRCRECGNRVEKLYISSRSNYFLCRHCLDLTYRSCQESGDRSAKIRRKLRKLYKKLGSSWQGAAYSTIPDKPKHMHYKTYFEIRGKIIDYERQLNSMLLEGMKEINRSLE